MKYRKAARVILITFGMVLLILDTETALKGATDAISSCIFTVIPSLLPFILLSCLLNDTVNADSVRIAPLISKIAGLPNGAGTILISAALGGYPAGAQAVHQAYSAGSVNKKDAERILAYANNAGPAFIFGLAGLIFQPISASFLLWGIHLISAFIVRLTIGPSEFLVTGDIRPSKGRGDIISTTAKVLCTVCVWVTVFGIIRAYIEAWTGEWWQPTIKTVIFGALELVNGCCSLKGIDDVRIRFIVCSGLLGFGGLCVMMQTVSVVHGLSVKYYLCGKLLQTVFSVSISAALVFRKRYLIVFPLIPVFIFLLRNKNIGRNPASIRV